MKSISLLQPWAGLLVLGIKEYETRSWNTKHRGLVAVHASARMPKEGKALLEELGRNNRDFKPGSYKYRVCTTLGAVLGEVEIQETFSSNGPLDAISTEEQTFGDYSPNRYFWKCINPRLYAYNLPWKGQLGLWNYDGPTE